MINIIPIDDLKEHDLQSTCECNPFMEILENNELMIVHNAYDGRVAVEKANELLSLPNNNSKGWLVSI